MAISTERLVLLVLLGVSVAVSAAIIGVPLVRTEKRALEERIDRHRIQLTELSAAAQTRATEKDDLEFLRRELSELTTKFYAPDEIDAFAFASMVAAWVTDLGMEIERSQPQAGEGWGRVELLVRGSAEELFTFLKGVSEYERVLSVPVMAVTNIESGDNLRIQLQVEYETVYSDID